MTVAGEVLTPFNVARVIGNFRITFAEERDVQLAIEEIFRRGCIPFESEFRLTPTDRPDFLIQKSIAVEVKIKSPAARVLRQLRRYAKHETISGLVLVTTRRLQAAQMPNEIEGKPLAICLIGGL